MTARESDNIIISLGFKKRHECRCGGVLQCTYESTKNKEYKIKTYPEANKYLMTNSTTMISRGVISTINTAINELIKEII
jgi:hypothetical protein